MTAVYLSFTLHRLDMLKSQRLVLYQPSEVTAAQLLDYELRNKTFFTPWVPLRTDEWFVEEAQQYRLQIEWQDQRDQKSYRFFIALSSDPQRVIADAGLSNIVRGAFHCAFLGYKIDERMQGQGIMQEALERVCAFAFRDLHLHRIEANIMPHNVRSIALIERLGFKREGYSEKYLRICDRWEDHVRYALLNELLT